jgi:hypothetical protein
MIAAEKLNEQQHSFFATANAGHAVHTSDSHETIDL